MRNKLKIIPLICLFTFLSKGEDGCCYSREYMRSFFDGSPFEVKADTPWETVSNAFYTTRELWIVWAENEIRERLSNFNVFGKRYRWDSPSLLGYEELSSSIRYAWGKAYSQRGKFGLEVEKTIQSLELLEEFQKRLSDSNDNLSDIVRYRQLLSISSVPGKLYWLAEKLYWDNNYDKAITVMSFFLLPENKDGFVRGAAHYFLGRSLTNRTDVKSKEELDEISQEALDHFVKVPAFPTCLTYISYAYIDGAKEASSLGDYKAALALTSIDVPSLDRDTVLAMRHYDAARYCVALRDYTNCIRHLQEATAANSAYNVSSIVKTMDYAYDKAELWNWCATNRLEYIDTHNAIVSALTNENSVVEFNDLYEALTIKWPTCDQLPQSIMTNRVLNNNFFNPPQDTEYKQYDNRTKKDKVKENEY